MTDRRDNGPQLDDWHIPARELRRHCGEDQATTHCVRCGHQIPPSPPRVVEPIDDWPYTHIDSRGTN